MSRHMRKPRIKVVCVECGKKFQTTNDGPGADRPEHPYRADERDARGRSSVCILDCDSPSYPPTDKERRECGCATCLAELATSPAGRRPLLRGK